MYDTHLFDRHTQLIDQRGWCMGRCCIGSLFFFLPTGARPRGADGHVEQRLETGPRHRRRFKFVY